jgi:hypothetical protein
MVITELKTEISDIISNKNLQPDIQGDVLKLKHLAKKRSKSQGHLSFYPIQYKLYIVYYRNQILDI